MSSADRTGPIAVSAKWLLAPLGILAALVVGIDDDGARLQGDLERGVSIRRAAHSCRIVPDVPAAARREGDDELVADRGHPGERVVAGRGEGRDRRTLRRGCYDPRLAT